MYLFYVLRLDGFGSYVGGGDLINMIERCEFFSRVHTRSVLRSLSRSLCIRIGQAYSAFSGTVIR